MPSSPGRILLTGASGFVGSAVVDRLLAAGYSVNALVHRHDVRAGDERVRSIRGDVTDEAAVESAMRGCDAAIHLVGIIAERPERGVTFQRMHVEATRVIVAAAQRGGVRRLVHMSALGTRETAESEYHKTKWAAEEIVRKSGLEWTIFRPSMIHGPGGELMKMEADWARRKRAPWLFMPYFGRGLLGMGGAGMIQPVYVGDVARAFVEALGNGRCVGGVYALAGAQRVTWPEFHRIASRAIVGKRRWTMAIPAWKAKLLTYIVPRSLLPFNRDQVVMALEDNTAGMGEFERDFGWLPGGLEEMIGAYGG